MATEPQIPGRAAAVLRSAARLALLLALAYGIHLLINWATDLTQNGHPGAQVWMLALLLLAYAILIAIPFVPGVEIGLSLLAMEGAWIAPYIYLSTLAGLMVAYAVGVWLPYARLHRALQDLRLHNVCRLLEGFQPLTRAQRLALLLNRAPRWLRPFVSSYRYFLLAALVNLPGNAILGGGGGILFVAGFSRLFTPLGVATTMALAVMPIPLTVWLFGINLLG
jgi:fumarate reductase subunit D